MPFFSKKPPFYASFQSGGFHFSLGDDFGHLRLVSYWERDILSACLGGEINRDRAPHDRNAMNNLQVIYNSYAELAAMPLPAVPVVGQDKHIGVLQRDWTQFLFLHLLSWKSCLFRPICYSASSSHSS